MFCHRATPHRCLTGCVSVSLQIWNPYGNDKMGHKSFICVEAVRNTNPVELVPGEGWHAAMSLRAAAK